MNVLLRRLLLAAVGVMSALPAGAQSPPAAATSTPPLLVIYREEVRPGRASAHAANEAAWAAAFAKGQAPVKWLGMTSLAGPTEAWFLSGYPSWEVYERVQTEMNTNAGFAADEDRFSSSDGDMLSRTSAIIAAYRPELSYQANISLPQMRYMQVEMFLVKPGHIDEFWETWEAIIAAHGKANLDEHWAVYQVTAGMPAGTFMFFYPMKSLAQIDKSGPMHAAATYRDAVGESGRARQREMNVNAVESSQRLIFQFAPNMSILGKEWIDGDPSFWTPKPPPAPAAKKK
jgi:hypothetical protein